MILPIPDAWPHDAWIALILSAVGQVRCVPATLMKYRIHSTNALGINQASLSEKLWNLAMSHPKEVSELVQRYMLAFTRLCEIRTVADSTVEILRQKILHLESRATLSDSRIYRARQVAHEVWRGGYRRYSNGWRTAVVDLLKRHVKSK